MRQEMKLRVIRCAAGCARVGGFTFIELMLVVLIIGIAAGIVVPMMSSAGSLQVRAAANMVAADLEYAKSMAISRTQSYSVEFNTTNESYEILDPNNDPVPHPVKKGFDYVVDFGNDGRLDQVDIADVNFPNDKVTFDYLGSPDNGGGVTLQAGGVTKTVNVEPVTGFISVSK
jgi:prepilin-type N-terminal cleavage/methylation domain-containing protein